jgi:hypothetical protein
MMPTASTTGSSTLSANAQQRHPHRAREHRNGRHLRTQTQRSATNQASQPSATPRIGFYKSTDPLRESISSISGALAANRGDNAELKFGDVASPAIWRKLSNSTTTMTKDEIRTLEDDGELKLVCGFEDDDERDGDGSAIKKPTDRNKFEWYTFEDQKEQTIRRRLTPVEIDSTRVKSKGRQADSAR